MARVALCIPCWNHLQFTQQMIESVRRNCSPHDITMVMLDDGSTDGTPDYLRSLSPAHLILKPSNQGVNAAWNDLMSVAINLDVDVVVLMNNDILVGPQWLDAAAFEIAKNEKRYFLPNAQFTNPNTFDDDVRAALPHLQGSVPARAGWCMIFHPSAIPLFHPIPASLKLWYGDDWIHHKLQQENGYTCEALARCCCLHYTSRSIGDYPDMVSVVARDGEEFRKLMSNE